MALDPYSELPAMKDALAGTNFYEQLDCINRVFEQNKIETIDALDNSPRYLTCSICGISLHQLIQQIRSYMEGVKEGSIVVEAKEETVQVEEEAEAEEVQEEIIIEEPEPEEVPVKKVRSRSKSSRRTKKE
jgi:transcription elongation factor Elf1